MSLFGMPLEMISLKKHLQILYEKDNEIQMLKREAEFKNRMTALKIEESLNVFKKEVSEKLIKSDIERNEAIAKVTIYEQLDARKDMSFIKDTLCRLVEILGGVSPNK